MAKFKIRHLVAKPQKGGHMLFYWQPSKSLREADFRPRRLAERTNNQVDAIAQAEALNAEVDQWRAGLGQETAPPDSIPWLIRLYRSDDAYT